MDGYRRAQDILPERIRTAAQVLPQKDKQTAMEFRLRCGQRPTVLLPEGERGLEDSPVTQGELRRLLELCSAASPYAAADALQNGFLTAPGGIRVGFGGCIVTEGGRIRTIKDFSSAAIRMVSSSRGSASFPESPILPRICRYSQGGRSCAS